MNLKKEIIRAWNNTRPSPFGPPRESGVYGVFCSRRIRDCVNHLVYIGAAKNVRKRVMNLKHVYRKLFNRLPPGRIVWTQTLELEKGYQIAEKILITHFKPVLNKQRYFSFKGIEEHNR